ncbi:MAG: hypothetical protein D6711_13885 [Chloroflexi bacterium]|nr:MAG: hypothetical protein D6711_13885 [Chloroflexota bacterium]
MPVPLVPAIILSLSALTGGTGIFKTVDSGARIKKAKDRYNRRRGQYSRAEQRYKKQRSVAEEKFGELGRRRLEALVTMGRAVDFLKKAKIRERELEQRFEITPQKLADWKGASVNAVEVLGGLVGSAGAGLATASAAYGLVGTLATASTGTAISTLSGAAATNATLAWLGGGSIAAGGGGMALGAMVLNGIIVGPGLLVAGFFAGRKAHEVETEIAKQIAQMDVAEAQMEQQLAVLKIVLRRVDELYEATNEVDMALQHLLEQSNPANLEEAYNVARTAKALGELLDVAITDKAGNLILN